LAATSNKRGSSREIEEFFQHRLAPASSVPTRWSYAKAALRGRQEAGTGLVRGIGGGARSRLLLSRRLAVRRLLLGRFFGGRLACFITLRIRWFGTARLGRLR